MFSKNKKAAKPLCTFNLSLIEDMNEWILNTLLYSGDMKLKFLDESKICTLLVLWTKWVNSCSTVIVDIGFNI